MITKLKTKILLSFLVSVSVLVALSLTVLFYFSGKSLEEAAVNQLEALTYSRASHIDSFIEERKDELLALSKDHHLSDLADESLRQESEEIPDLWDKLGEGVRLYDHTLEALNSISFTGTKEVFILNKRGEVILSTDETKIGTERSDDDYFITARDTKSLFIKDIHISELDQAPSIIISAPLYSIVNGDFVGVIVKRFDVENLNKIVSDAAGLRGTEEVYIVNNNGYMVTNSRFRWDTILKQAVSNSNYAKCVEDAKNSPDTGLHLESQGEKMETFLNYKGVASIGSHVYIPGMKWCLLSEIEENEALSKVRNLMYWSLVIFGVIIVISIIVARYFVGIITNPIEELNKGIEIIEKGNLDYKVRMEREDEIGRLSQSFDRMVDSIKESREEVDRQVKEQTVNLKKQQEKLMKQNEELEETKKIIEKSAKESEKSRKEAEKALAQAELSKADLEKINENLVNREVKMIELKEELNRLRSGLPKK